MSENPFYYPPLSDEEKKNYERLAIEFFEGYQPPFHIEEKDGEILISDINGKGFIFPKRLKITKRELETMLKNAATVVNGLNKLAEFLKYETTE